MKTFFILHTYDRDRDLFEVRDGDFLFSGEREREPPRSRDPARLARLAPRPDLDLDLERL